MTKLSKTAVFSFGRHNPPTIGHQKLIDKTIDHAKEIGGSHYIFTSHSQDSKKNPLSGEEKANYIKKANPNANVGVSNKTMSGPVQIAKHLHSLGHEHLVMVAGSDRVDEYHKLLHKYNGKDYNFKSIKVVSAGHRDPDAEGAEGMSGTKMRSAAISGNKEQFKSGLMQGLSDSHKEEIYHKVRKNMGINENKINGKQIPFLLMTENQKQRMMSLVEETQITFANSTTQNFDQCPKAVTAFKNLIGKVDNNELKFMQTTSAIHSAVSAGIAVKPSSLGKMQRKQYLEI